MDERMRENFRIEEIGYDRKTCLPLLLLGDEQEDMIDRYIGRSRLYAMYERDRMVCICAVTDEGGGLCEIKNLATAPGFRRRGYGKAMIGFVERHYRRSHRVLQAGTGESPATLGFYERCGFVFSHRLPDFFYGQLCRSHRRGGGTARRYGLSEKRIVTRTRRDTARNFSSDQPHILFRTGGELRKIVVIFATYCVFLPSSDRSPSRKVGFYIRTL